MDDVGDELNENEVSALSVIDNSATVAEKLSKTNSSIEEDLLGVNSLLMSDSDNEHDEKEQVGEVEKIRETKITVNLELNSIVPMESKEIEVRVEDDQTEDLFSKKKKKYSAILDSESDENEPTSTAKKTTVSRKPKYSTLIDSDTESDSEKNPKNEERNEIKINDKNEKDEEISKNIFNKKSSVFATGLIDSDSDSNSETIDQEELDNLQHTDNDGKQIESDEHKKKPMRASAKKALDEMQSIQSEQQRLHREAHISVPYHKPKRHTLQEFLKRRTIIKPAVENDCSPAAAILKKKSLKMTPEELEEYAKLMDDRAQEAKEFFKSESESENEELKDNIGVMDSIDQHKTTNLDEIEKPIEESITKEYKASDQVSIGEDKSAITESMDIGMELEPKSQLISSQPLVTEVLELPNLDLSTLNVNEKDITPISINPKSSASDSVHPDIRDLKRQLINEQILTDTPTIKGDPNMIIDLESGDIIKKKPSSAENLLERLLATHRARKAKTNETVNIMSTDNGKLEITKVNIHIKDDDGVNKDHKPGEAYVKLKENLRTLIKKKRLEEMKKKQEDEHEYNKCLEDYDDDDDFDEEEYESANDDKDKKKSYKFDNIVIDDEENALEVENDDGIHDDEALEQDDDEEEGEEGEENVENDRQEEYKDEVGADNDNEENSSDEIDEDMKSESSIVTDTDKDDSDDNGEDLKCDLEKDNESKVPLTTTQRKNRILKPFAADSDDEDDDMDLLKTQIRTVHSNITNSVFSFMNSPVKSCMDLPCTNDFGVNNTQELLNLCSGSFDVTQNSTAASSNAPETALISQIPITQPLSLKNASEELLELCSGRFDENNAEEQAEGEITKSISTTNSIPNPDQSDEVEKVNTIVNRAKILSSDDDNDDEKTNNIQVDDDRRKRVKKLRKKLKKRQVKLGFSDDEEEIEEPVTAEEVENENNDIDGEENDDIPETYVEYDSEENEVIVEMTAEERVKRAENFFEKEAELSESDWGSADEDEKNMDEYDIEMGDEDQFDRAKLQQELGQIHARKILDEDIREIRKIQELLFEDEENDGVGRQRQFRWKNIESGFSLDDVKAGEDGTEGGDSGDEEQKQEHLWRKIRFEREQLLKEQGDNNEISATALSLNSPLASVILKNSSTSKNSTPILGSNGKKIQIITKHSMSKISVQKKGSPFLISSNKTTTTTTTAKASILQPKVMRGSFLIRDKETLTKIANLKKNPGFEEEETAGTVSTKGKNFVFTTLSKEEHEQLKRKADDLINSSPESGTNFMKKPRANTDKKCLIDQLLR